METPFKSLIKSFCSIFSMKRNKLIITFDAVQFEGFWISDKYRFSIIVLQELNYLEFLNAMRNQS